jgi:hypothetical protein
MAQQETTVQYRVRQGAIPCCPLPPAKVCSTAVVCATAMKKSCSSGTSFTGWRGLRKCSALPKVNGPTYQILTKINQIMKKAYLYTRSCRVDEEGTTWAGPQRQEEKLREHCRANNLTIAGVFSDIGNGMTFERPGFGEMLASIKVGRRWSTLLLFHTWDRFCRDYWESTRMVSRLEERGIVVKAIENPAETVFAKVKNSNRAV